MILVDGVVSDEVAALDRGLQYGDGVFETVATRDGRCEYWPEHIARLQAGCARLGFLAPDGGLLRAEAERALADSHGAGVLKIIVTRGVGGRGYRPPSRPEPVRIVAAFPFPDHPPSYAEQGIRLHACRTPAADHPALAGLKHLNRLPQVLARAEWDDPAAPEGLMRDLAGHPVEGTQSNLFLVRDGVLLTPDLSTVGVAGIIRARVLALATAGGIEARVESLPVDALDHADEVFVCNSLIGIWPVNALEHRAWPVGPVTRTLQTALDDERRCRSG
ncbi:MAG: aminodeoxychorismate lyase [Chromatiales bacterium]|nr:aminodeoxychorismate lyase [Gammaproteobacteria bacterium]MCP5352519.1 aminodeoxychorismate lyase [Chromatiales bacterium]